VDHETRGPRCRPRGPSRTIHTAHSTARVGTRACV